MNSKRETDQALSRRNALKALAATGGAVALSTVPKVWETPLVEVGALPAFAVASAGTFSFEAGAIRATVDGNTVNYTADPAGATATAGWLRIVTDGTSPLGNASADWEHSPVRNNAPWSASGGVEVAITFCFRLKIIYPGPYPAPDDLPIPAPGTPFRCFGWHPNGQSGYIDGLLGNFNTDLTICTGFTFELGSTPPYFYFTMSFMNDIITLLNGSQFNVTNFQSPGIYKSISRLP